MVRKDIARRQSKVCAYPVSPELGHVTKACPQEKVEIASREIECSNCHEVGHR